MKTILIACMALVGLIGSTTHAFGQKSKIKENMQGSSLPKTDKEWKSVLNEDEYYVLREKGTERPYTGKFLLHKEKGVYTCRGCGAPLFSSNAKFDAHCGWPSFDREIKKGVIKQTPDYSHGMNRIEITCGKCGGHLGHVFDDGPTDTGLRYCVNSLSLGFEKAKP